MWRNEGENYYKKKYQLTHFNHKKIDFDVNKFILQGKISWSDLKLSCQNK